MSKVWVARLEDIREASGKMRLERQKKPWQEAAFVGHEIEFGLYSVRSLREYCYTHSEDYTDFLARTIEVQFKLPMKNIGFNFCYHFKSTVWDWSNQPHNKDKRKHFTLHILKLFE